MFFLQFYILKTFIGLEEKVIFEAAFLYSAVVIEEFLYRFESSITELNYIALTTFSDSLE